MLRVGNLPGYGNGGGFTPDPDLDGLDPEWVVTIEQLEVPHYRQQTIAFPDQVRRYANVYRKYGPWGMPPVVIIRDHRSRFGDRLLTGNHRLAAAALANVDRVPAFIIHVPSDEEFDLSS